MAVDDDVAPNVVGVDDGVVGVDSDRVDVDGNDLS